ncbi:histidine kinase [Opitutaceae bacterium TAV5]|nr:histidine kinase [Opitutaceae bacterium TAV5]
MKPFWMRSLTSQWIALMLAALVLSQVFFFVIYRSERVHALREVQRDDFFTRTASAARLVDTTAESLHPEILRATGTIVARYWLSAEAPDDTALWQQTARSQLMRSWNAAGRGVAEADVPVIAGATWTILGPADWAGERPARFLQLDAWNGFGLALRTQDGQWLNCVYAKPWATSGPLSFYYVSFIITALLLSLAAVLATRRVGRPLGRLTRSAEALGRGEEAPLLPEEGADDIRRTAAAFNRMQLRIRRFVEDRTRMMAAISHDLRTPITSLRLQAEFVEDSAIREKLISTLDEMKAMTEATLAFAREDATVEPTRTVNIDALIESLCDDFADLGQNVTATEVRRIAWRCRPDALRRALRNVIENAVRYGDCARVRMSPTEEWLDIQVDDDGPGIPEEDRERVFAPFVRLERSRNRATGGVGLGLAIARTIMHAHGGEIALANREGGGLRVVLRLPRD